jgi:hypothetical protein
VANSNEIKEFRCFQPGESLFAYDVNRDVYVETSQRVGQGIPGDKTGTLTQEGEQNSAESGGPAGRVGQAAGVRDVRVNFRDASGKYTIGPREGDKIHVKPEWQSWLTPTQVQKLQWRRAQVAQQQSQLLTELADDAVAPPRETTVLVIEGLRREVAGLQSCITDMYARIRALESHLREGGTFSVQNPVAVTTAPLNGKTATMTVVDGARACEHDCHKANTTVSAITRKKSRCTVCAQVWELP